jgi:uncharacterized delta-60 repeat protein
MLPMMGQEPGTLDTDFQDGGMLLLAPFGATSFENAQDVIALEDGSIVFCGVVGTVSNFDVAVLKLDPDGNLDPTFGTDGAYVFENDLSSDQAYSMAALPDGRIVVGGAMGFGGSDYRATVWCLLPDGTPDPDFGTEGRFQYTFDDGEEYIRRVLVTDTHITMVATVKVPGFTYDRIGLVQCTHDGVLDQAFGQDGAIIHIIDETTDLSVRDGERLSSGGIAVGGYHYSLSDNNEYPFVGLFDANGQPQADFGTNGINIGTQPGEYFAMAVDGDILYLAGRTNGDVRDFMIDALDVDGALYTPFAAYGHFELDNALTDLILDLVIDEEGRLLASGTSGIPGFFGDRDFALLRLLPDGTPDPLFGTNGLTTTTFGTAFDDANALVITPQNKAVLVGMSAQTNNDFAIARYFLGPVVDGVEEWTPEFSVYPNPTAGFVRLSAGTEVVKWTLTDALGRPVDVPMNVTGGQAQWDLSELPDGAYQLTIEHPSGHISERVLVRH